MKHFATSVHVFATTVHARGPRMGAFLWRTPASFQTKMSAMKKTTYTILIFLLQTAALFAQPEFLDPDFGTAGRQTLVLPAADGVSDLALQPDGKIVLAGQSVEGENLRISLARYLPDGSLDSGFGLNGTNHTLLPDDIYGSAEAIALQSDGKIVALAGSHNLLRYKANGYPDPSFPMPLELNFLIYYNAIAIGADNKIVVAGSGLNTFNGFVITSILPDGTKDPAFGTDATVKLDFGSGYERAMDVAVQPDGKIVAFGRYQGFGADKSFLVVVRLNANGTLDNSFNLTGKILIDNGGEFYDAKTLLLQPDGKIVVGASGLGASGSGFFSLFRFNPDGTPDDTFGTDGKARMDDFYSHADFAMTPDGSVIVPGYVKSVGNSIIKFTAAGVRDSSFADAGILHASTALAFLAVQTDTSIVAAYTLGGDFALTRYLPDGMPDPTFNTGTLVITNIGQSGGSFGALAVQPDGKIVAAGGNSGYSTTLARFASDGTLDGDFFIKNKFLTTTNGAFHALVLQPDGKILAGGSYGGEGVGGIFYRFLTDGALDSSFSSWHPVVNSLALQPDGKILTAGVGYDDTGHYWSDLFRFQPDGMRDTSFGTNGWVSTNPCKCVNMALQSDGNILVSGSKTSAGYVVMRYRSDGYPDSTFGTNGSLPVPAHGLLRGQPDGKFLLVRTTDNGSEIHRFLPDGTPDLGFGNAGIVSLPSNNGRQIHTLELQADGKILLAGQVNSDFLLMRLLSDGTPDTTAGIGGTVTADIGGLFSDDQAYAIALQPDGKIVLAGTSLLFTDTSAYTAFSLARFRADLLIETQEVTGARFQALELTPNPAGDFLKIEWPENLAAESFEIQLLDATGRQVRFANFSKAEKPQTIDLHGLAPGIYLLKGMSGGLIFVGKFIKQ